MKNIAVAVILGTLITGIYDGGDITGAVILTVLFTPIIFQKKKEKRSDGKA